MILTSTRSGNLQSYKLDVSERIMTQLTENEIASHILCLDQKRIIAYYWSERFLKSVDLESFETSVIYTIPKGYLLTILSITPDDRYLTFFEKLELSNYRGESYYKSLEYVYRIPRSLIVRDKFKERGGFAV